MTFLLKRLILLPSQDQLTSTQQTHIQSLQTLESQPQERPQSELVTLSTILLIILPVIFLQVLISPPVEVETSTLPLPSGDEQLLTSLSALLLLVLVVSGLQHLELR